MLLSLKHYLSHNHLIGSHYSIQIIPNINVIKIIFLHLVTEHEVRNGIFGSDFPDRHGLAFIRDMTGLNPDTYTEEMATRYKDTITVDGQVS